MSHKKYIAICLYIGCILGESLQEQPKQESFLLEKTPVQSSIKKKKPTLSALRNECAELCEDYAHALVTELMHVSIIMPHLLDTKNQNLFQLYCQRCTSLKQAETFLLSGQQTIVQQPIDKFENVMDAAWKMVQNLARIQKVLLTCIRQLLEQDATHFCMLATKQQLKEYAEHMRKIIRESDIFVENFESLYAKIQLPSK